MSAYTKQTGGSHYKNFKIQPGEYCHKNGFGNYESDAIGYISRYKLKWKGDREKQLEDLQKAIHSLELLIEEIQTQPKDYKINEIKITDNYTPNRSLPFNLDIAGVRSVPGGR
jgi:hypothetical protein